MTTTAEVPQHLQALQRANNVRLARAHVKRNIAAGKVTVAEVLQDVPECCLTMSLGELLRSQVRWGKTRTRRLLASCQLSEMKRLESMTERQLNILAEALS